MTCAAAGPLACAAAGRDCAVPASPRNSLPAVPPLRAGSTLFSGSDRRLFWVRRPPFPSG